MTYGNILKIQYSIFEKTQILDVLYITKGISNLHRLKQFLTNIFMARFGNKQIPKIEEFSMVVCSLFLNWVVSDMSGTIQIYCENRIVSLTSALLTPLSE